MKKGFVLTKKVICMLMICITLVLPTIGNINTVEPLNLIIFEEHDF